MGRMRVLASVLTGTEKFILSRGCRERRAAFPRRRTTVNFLMLACSGPGAADAIAESGLISTLCGLGSLALTIFIAVRAFKLRHTALWLALAGCVALVLLVGLFTMTLRGGDCGFTARYASIAVFVGILGLTGLTFTARKTPVA